MKSGKSSHGIQLAIIVGVFAASLVVGQRQASADAKAQIDKKVADAMENYDLMDFEVAKKLLNQAIVIAKKNRVAKKRYMARVYLTLGIVHFSGLKDKEAAKLEFINAVEIDKGIKIPKVYKTGPMEALLNEAKKEFGGRATSTGGTGGTGGGSSEPSVDCGSLSGIAHTIVDTAPAGADKAVSAHVAGSLGASKVVLHYRPKGAANFSEVKMGKSGDCGYKATIPGKAIRGDFMHYYVAAYNSRGKQVARKGSSGSPNVIEILASTSDGGTGSDGGGLDTENPLAKGGGSVKRKSTGGGGVKKGLTGGTNTSKLFISVAVGTGAGFVTGNTEQEQNEVGCCVAPALLHLFPEIGYFVSPTTSLSVAFRLGFTIGANIQGHSTGAPAALLRLRKSLSEDGNGLQLNASIGGGIIRHTVKLANAPAEMDTDTTATGPVFIGGGAAYTKPMGGSLKFVAELNAIAGIPIVEEFGGVKPNFALHVDVNIGFMFGF